MLSQTVVISILNENIYELTNHMLYMYVSIFTGIIVHALLQVEEQKLANKEDFIIHTQLPSSSLLLSSQAIAHILLQYTD